MKNRFRMKRWATRTPRFVFLILGLATVALAQNKCPQGFVFVGTLYGSGSFGSNYNGHPQVTFPANARIDSSFQQASVHPENGQSDAHSPITAQQIPKGIYIVPYGSDDHEKGWAVHSPELKGIEWDDNATITRYVFGMTLYCTTGSGEADRLVGGCNVNVDVCYQPKVPIIAKKMGVILRAANLRSDPSTAHKPVGLLYTNEEVELLSSEAVRGFFQVKTKDGRQGWVGKQFVKVRA